mgnify:CR=1 FL=1
MQLLVASRNPEKIQEIRTAFQVLPITVVSPAEVGVPEEFDVEETGQTFEENAELKARGFSQQSGLLAIADDSGLLVTALNNRPGVHSKRFFPGSDKDRVNEVLRQLETHSDRSAKFVSVIAWYDPQIDICQFFEGEVTGTIALATEGEAGFGYDPIFVPTGYQDSFGQLGDQVKGLISHRAMAMAKLFIYLQEKK